MDIYREIDLSTINTLQDLNGDELLKALGFPFEGDETEIMNWMNSAGLMTGFVSIRRLLLDRNVVNATAYDIVCENALKAVKATVEKLYNFKSRCPEEGEFYGYKFIVLDPDYKWMDRFDVGIVKLRIPSDSKRISPYTGEGKCRCSRAFVEEIWKARAVRLQICDHHELIDEGDETFSQAFRLSPPSIEYYKNEDGSIVTADCGFAAYDTNFVYKTGETVESDLFDSDRWKECSHGIHFFMTPKEAESYGLYLLQCL